MASHSNQRTDGRRRSDLQRQMLEEAVTSLPRYFVAVVGEETYSSYFDHQQDAGEFIRSLVESGVRPDQIAYYERCGENDIGDLLAA
ncbi:MAG: hypothetical protein HY719_17655 [Planctomycetes bacterium]|nr:hypothetical protein [Planctomycetota bacterium]